MNERTKLLERIDKVKWQVDELGELTLSTHTRPLKHTTGHAAICEILNDVKRELSRPSYEDCVRILEEYRDDAEKWSSLCANFANRVIKAISELGEKK